MTTKGSLFSVGTTTISGKTEAADRVIWRHRINHPSPKQVVKKKGIEIKRKKLLCKCGASAHCQTLFVNHYEKGMPLLCRAS